MFAIVFALSALLLAAIAFVAKLSPLPACIPGAGRFARVALLVVGVVCLTFMAQSAEAAVRVKVRGAGRGNVQVNVGGGRRVARPPAVVVGVPGHVAAVNGFGVFPAPVGFGGVGFVGGGHCR